MLPAIYRGISLEKASKLFIDAVSQVKPAIYRGIGMRHIFESRLLLVDDNKELQSMVEGILKREGFLDVGAASGCKEAENYILANHPDLIILDVNLPDGDGFSLMQKIRTVSDVPVLFLSARDKDSDRLFGLGLGADDYMIKPFLPKELTLRVSAILKRTYFPLGMKQQEEPEQLVLGEKVIDFRSGTISTASKQEAAGACPEQEISMTAKEIALLKKLAENRGNIVTFDALCQAVWGDGYYGYENTIMVHIRRLREKIEENPSSPRWLITVRGLGYKLAKQV